MRIRWLLAALCLPAAASSLPASTIYVDARVPRTDGDGKSWATAYPSVSAALQTAQSGDEVWVAAGTYPTGAQMRAGVALYGGFVGMERFRDQHPGLPGLTVLRNQQTNAGPIAIQAGAGRDTIVDGLTIEMTGPSPYPALALRDTSPTIRHNVITDSGGTGIFCGDTAAEITNNTIAGNAGNGIACERARGPVANNIVAFNQTGVRVIATDLPVLRNNCVYGNAGGNYVGLEDPTGADGNIAQDPRFAAFELGNLHVQPDSPCVDAGWEDAPRDDLDFDLLTRVMGARVDIGADESDGRRWAVTPRVVRVSPTGNDAHDGSSWALAKASLPSAVDLASVTGGEVWVAAGTYMAGEYPAARGPFILPSHVALYGGFDGTEARRGQRDWGRNPTILTARSSGPILRAISGNRTSRLDGFLILGNRPAPAISGIVCTGAGPVIANNVFAGLGAATGTTGGSVVNAVGGAPLLFNNAITTNTGTAYGLLSFAYSAPTLSHNYISGNSTTSNGVLVRSQADAGFVMRNNLVAGNIGAVPVLGAYNTQRLEFVNNTVVNNSIPLGNYTFTLVANNIFALSGASAVWRPGIHDTVRDNCF